MIVQDSVGLRAPREAGVVYTRPWLVELILDLAGYLPERPLSRLVAMEPAAGDGAFLRAMVCRLVDSCELHDVPITGAMGAIAAFEIDPRAAQQAIAVVEAILEERGVQAVAAADLARTWVKAEDFLEASLAFPIADFAVGNPPYIRLEEIPGHKAAFYRSAFSTMRGRADVYVAFYQAALQQLRPGGVCAYVCANRWMLNDYGSALREFITTEGFNVRCLLEAHAVDAFESEVSAYPAVTIIAREPQGAVVVAKARRGIETARRGATVELLVEARSDATLTAARFPTWFRGREPWPCSSVEALSLLKRLEATCLPLESRSTRTRIGIGVASGADDVFITSGRPDVEPSRLLPLALAGDLQAGRVRWSGHHLVNPWDGEGLVNLASYPRMEAYLRAHHAKLAGRHTAKERPSQWHKTIDRVNLDLLKREKLYIADIKDRLLPALDLGKTYPQHNLYWITSETWDLRVLGGLLMSAVGEFFVRCYGVRMRGGFLRFQAQYLRRIRLPAPSDIDPVLAETLRQAFDAQDTALATEAAMRAYRIDSLPE